MRAEELQKEEKKKIDVRSGIRTHAYRSRLRPERSALDRSAILTPMLSLIRLCFSISCGTGEACCGLQADPNFNSKKPSPGLARAGSNRSEQIERSKGSAAFGVLAAKIAANTLGCKVSLTESLPCLPTWRRVRDSAHNRVNRAWTRVHIKLHWRELPLSSCLSSNYTESKQFLDILILVSFETHTLSLNLPLRDPSFSSKLVVCNIAIRQSSEPRWPLTRGQDSYLLNQAWNAAAAVWSFCTLHTVRLTDPSDLLLVLELTGNCLCRCGLVFLPRLANTGQTALSERRNSDCDRS